MRLTIPVLLSLTLLLAACEEERVYEIEHFDVVIDVREDGSYGVEETITFDFTRGTFTEGFRSIPGRGLEAIEEVSVRGIDVTVNEVAVERDGRDRLITWTFAERSGPTTFVVSYVVRGALIERDGLNVIDWNAVGQEVEVPIRHLRAEITVPNFEFMERDLVIDPREDGVVERVDRGWRASFSHQQLPAGAGYRITVSFPKRFDGRAPPSPPWFLLVGGAGFLIAILPGAAAYLQRRRTRSVRTPANRSQPHLAEADLLLSDDLSLSQRAYPAMLFALAQRGHLELRQAKRKRWHGEEEVLEVHPRGSGNDLTSTERSFLTELEQAETFQGFLGKAWTFTFHASRSLREDLVMRGWLVDLRASSNRMLVLASAAAAGGIALAFAATGWSVALIIGLTVGAVGGALMAASVRCTRTTEGDAVREAVRTRITEIRESVEHALEINLSDGLLLMMEHLPWLFLDPQVSNVWFERVEARVEEAGADIQLPGWIKQAVGNGDESPAQLLLSTVHTAHLASTSTATFGGASTGAGAVGASGGGAVGAR